MTVETSPRGWPDTLSDWALPPSSACAAGENEPVRVFESAEAALRFLAGQSAATAPAERRAGRVLPARAA